MTPATIRVAWLERVGGEQAVGRDDPRQHRHPGGGEERADDRLEAREREQRGDASRAGDEDHPSDDDGPQRVRHEHDPAPVVAVGVGAREQADRDRRQRDEDRHQGDRRGRAGEVEDEQEQREIGHPVADVGDRLGEVEAAEVGDAEEVADADRRVAVAATSVIGRLLGVDVGLDEGHGIERDGRGRRRWLGARVLAESSRRPEPPAKLGGTGGGQPGEAARQEERGAPGSSAA